MQYQVQVRGTPEKEWRTAWAMQTKDEQEARDNYKYWLRTRVAAHTHSSRLVSVIKHYNASGDEITFTNPIVITR